MSYLAEQEAGSLVEGLGHHLVQFTRSLCEEAPIRGPVTWSWS